MGKKNQRKKADIIIDESKLEPVPSVAQRLKHSLMGIAAGIGLAQLVLYAAWEGSIVILWFGNLKFLLIGYVAACGILGWISGEKFVQSVNKESANWWDLWNRWG